ncbi:uncharacterized protein LOC123011354 [Tribolium madens]|uniref:uncharacterized protein LOC123011354 n=1 Tax=Tribolium madens TaxID=41895 RepID=UPI001CF72A35|nr:uncharacterized protein LOC123011354 [Tribolium madens]
MFSRLLLLFYICLFTVVAGDSQSLRTAEDDAVAAFQKFQKVAFSRQNGAVNLIEKYYSRELDLMHYMQSNITNTVNRKLDSTKFYIQAAQESVNRLNVTTCNYDYSSVIEGMRTKLIDRTTECVTLYRDVYWSLYNSTVMEANGLFNNMMGCQARSRGQCQALHKNDDCFYFYISNAQKAEDVITDAYNLMTANYVNKINDIVPTCVDLINIEISLWPDYYLHTVTECAENELRNLKKSVCPYDMSLNK